MFWILLEQLPLQAVFNARETASICRSLPRHHQVEFAVTIMYLPVQ
jgi:hypothetical protein